MTDAVTALARAGEAGRLPQGPRTHVELRVTPVSGSALVRDYLSAEARLAPFYAAYPFDPDALHRKAANVAARLPRERRTAIAPALRATNAAAQAKLECILAGDGVFVTTGQQAGLFGGPLYTIYKALSAVRLAESLETLLGAPCLAVFWVASDDHDWDEVNQAAALDGDSRLERITIPTDVDAPAVPMSEKQLGASIEQAVQAFESLLPRSEFVAPVESMVRQTYRSGVSMGRAFVDLLHSLLHRFDIALLDPSTPALKKAALPILLHELRNAERHAHLLAWQSERLIEAGYHAQVTIAPDAANVFVHDVHGRERLVRESDGWVLRRTKRTLPDDEVFALLESEPAQFSPNVLLRPVVESALLPTVAYVGGPAEIAYFGQIGCLFGAHGIEPPIVYPRFSVTLVEGRVRKVLDKFDLELRDFERPFDALATQVMQDSLPDEVTTPLERLRDSIRSEYDRMAESASRIDPTLHGWLTGQRNRALAQIDAAEKKIVSHSRKRSEIETEQLRKAAAHLWPDGAPQERVLNVLPFLARYGDALLEDIAEAMEVRLDRRIKEWKGVECG